MKPTDDTIKWYNAARKSAMTAQYLVSIGLWNAASNVANEARDYWLRVRWGK